MELPGMETQAAGAARKLPWEVVAREVGPQVPVTWKGQKPRSAWSEVPRARQRAVEQVGAEEGVLTAREVAESVPVERVAAGELSGQKEAEK